MTETGTESETESTRTESASDDDRSWWATTWPLHLTDAATLGVALVVVVAIWVALGELLTNWSTLAGVVRNDEDIAQELANGRTPLQTDLAHWGAFIANTPVKIGLSIAIAALLLWRLRRWHEAVMIGLPLIFEATAFIITTYIVERPRPDVERLLDSPVNSSFPSGHAAAATVYAALVLIVFWHVRSTLVRVAAVLLAVAAAVVVAWARMYQGMHYLTDVLAGIALGVVSIAICARVLGPPDDAVTSIAATTDDPVAMVSDGPAS